MKKTSKIILSISSVLSLFSLSFWVGTYFCGGCSYFYFNQEVINDILIFFAIVIPVFAICVVAIIFMFRSKKAARVVCTILLILVIPISLFGSFICMLCTGIIGPNGCSFTEDIANYGKYDEDFRIPHFPEVVTDDMSVVDFSYFYKYIDIGQTDIYLEVKFENKEIMDKYLKAAKNSFSENGIITYKNPYNPKYRDIVENRSIVHSDDKYASVIKFEGDENHKYVNMKYSSITYSYDELTIIYNYTSVGSDLKVGNKPNQGEYYPKILARFGVEWDSDNNFQYKYIDN